MRATMITAILLIISIIANVFLFLGVCGIYLDIQLCPYKQEHGCRVLKTSRKDYNRK